MAAGWVRSGGVSSYNAYGHPPNDVRLQLKRLGLDTETLEKEEKFRIIDWYTCQLGQKSNEKYAYHSLKIADLSIVYSKTMIPAAGSPFPGTRYHLGPDVLRMGDDDSILMRFNDEKSFMEYHRTREIPVGPARKSTNIDALVKDVWSQYVYKSWEAAVDGIIDFKFEEENKTTRDLMRIRSMRNVHFDREWHELKVAENFEVTLEK